MRLKVTILCLAGLLFFYAPLWAAPTLLIETHDYDFGEIVQGETFDYTFRFQNSGDQVLEISNVRSSCGCTAALLTERKLAPGVVGELKVSFNSRGFRGKVKKMVTFETNDPQHAEVTFALGGLVTAELYITPQRVNWGTAAKGQELVGILEIVNDSKRAVTLEPHVTSTDLKVKLSTETLAAGEKATATVTGRFADGKDRLAGYVLINTDSTSVPQLKVPFSARLKDMSE